MVLLFLIGLLLLLTFSKEVSKLALLVVYVALAAVSKLYHRFFKSTLGIDLVLFFTIVSALYHGTAASLFVGWVGLTLADIIGTRFSHTSMVSLIALTLIAVIAPILPLAPVYAAILLTILYELITVGFYFLLGSSLPKILIYWSSHIFFNMFLILTYIK